MPGYSVPVTARGHFPPGVDSRRGFIFGFEKGI